MNTCGTIIGLTLALIMTQFLPQTEGSQIKNTLYTKKKNCRVDQSQETPLCRNGTCRGGRASCVYACSTHAQCTSVNFRPSNGLCMGVSNPLYGFGSVFSTDNNWENFSPAPADVRDGDWILVFRAKSSVDSSWTGKTMAAWNNDTIRSDDDLETLDPSCYANTAAACTDFFRSRWLGTWPSADIDQVRLALYAGGYLKVEMVFNGQGSTRDNWFNTDRLVSSSWSDLLPADPNNFISIAGQQAGTRIFVATTTTDESSCAWVGWLLVMNKPANRCPFDHVSNAPQFLYSPVSNKINFQNDPYKKADVMAIFIKLR